MSRRCVLSSSEERRIPDQLVVGVELGPAPHRQHIERGDDALQG